MLNQPDVDHKALGLHGQGSLMLLETGPQAQLTVQRGAPTQEDAQDLPEGEARALLGSELHRSLGRSQSCAGRADLRE